MALITLKQQFTLEGNVRVNICYKLCVTYLFISFFGLKNTLLKLNKYDCFPQQLNLTVNFLTLERNSEND